MKSAFALLVSTILGSALLVAAAPASEWMDHGVETCPQKTIQITNQIGKDFYQDHCKDSICVGTKGLSFLNSTTMTGNCAQKDVYCAASYDSVMTEVVTTDVDYTVSYPKGHVLCSLPPWTKSSFLCSNGASTKVDIGVDGLAEFNSFSKKDAVVSGYFKSSIDSKGCAKTATYGASKKVQDIFYPVCGKPAGETVCV